MKRLIWPMLSLMLISLLSACASTPKPAASSPSAGSAPTQPTEVLKIGVFTPLTGPTANYGEAHVNGAKLAVSEINDKGGLKIDGKQYKVELVIYDDRASPQEASAIMEKLASRDKVIAAMGTVSTTGTFAAMEVAERVKMVVMSPFASAPKMVTSGFKYFFRGGSTPMQEWENMPKYWAGKGVKSVGFLTLNDDYGKSNVQGMTEAFEKLGVKVTNAEWFSLKDTDLYTQLTKLKAAKPDLISTTSQVEQGALILKQLREIWPEATVAMSGSLDPGRLVGLAGAAADGVVLATPEPPATDRNLAFDKNYVELYKVPVFWGYSKLSYDTTMVIARAFERAGTTTDAEKLRAAMLQTNHDGLAAQIKFQENGEANIPLYYARIEKGKASIFDPRKN